MLFVFLYAGLFFFNKNISNFFLKNRLINFLLKIKKFKKKIFRALQFPPEGWLRMSIGHSSITRLVIRPNGLVSLQSYGDIGHLPADKISFS